MADRNRIVDCECIITLQAKKVLLSTLNSQSLLQMKFIWRREDPAPAALCEISLFMVNEIQSEEDVIRSFSESDLGRQKNFPVVEARIQCKKSRNLSRIRRVWNNWIKNKTHLKFKCMKMEPKAPIRIWMHAFSRYLECLRNSNSQLILTGLLSSAELRIVFEPSWHVESG